MKRSCLRNFLAALTLTTGLAVTQASAQTVEQFYKGRTIVVLVGTAPGGINDITARFAAKNLTRFIPGHPTLSVQYTPGGGGLVTANRIANTTEADGLTIAKLERATPQLAVLGNPQAKFDPLKLHWLGSMSSYRDDAYLMLLNHDAPIQSVDDIRAGSPGKITLGANNAASSNLIFGVIAKEALHLNVNVVRGYTGAAPMFLAMQRHEIDGQFVGISSVKTGQRAMWEKRAFKVPVLFGRTSRHPEFPDVPTGRELTKDASMLALIDFAEIPFFMSLPFVAPPGVPADRVKALQDAFMAMCRDRDVLAEAAKLGIEMSPIDSAEIMRLLARMTATPKEVIARYNALGSHAETRKDK